MVVREHAPQTINNGGTLRALLASSPLVGREEDTNLKMSTVGVPVVMREQVDPQMFNNGGTLRALLTSSPVVGNEGETNGRMSTVGVPGVAEVQKIMETPTHPAALYLKKMKVIPLSSCIYLLCTSYYILKHPQHRLLPKKLYV